MSSSFSVTAAEFVPMALRQAKASTAADPISLFNHHVTQQQQQQQQGRQPPPAVYAGDRAVVCTPYFRTGVCPDPSTCPFAHSLYELNPATQQQLLAVSGGEEMLPQHFLMAGTPFGGSSRPHNNGGGPSGGGGGGSHGGGGTSRRKGPLWEDAKVSLPQRCWYPHLLPGTYYDHLNVKRNCGAADIEAAYRAWRSTGYKSARVLDQTKADTMDRFVVDAKLVLGHPIMRTEYDLQLPPLVEAPAVIPTDSDPASIW